MFHARGRFLAFLLFLCPLAAIAAPEDPPGMCHAGAYALSDGSKLVISPSDSPNLRYRFTDGRAGKLFPTGEHTYESGDGWSAREPVMLWAEFGPCGEGRLRFDDGARPLTGRRIDLPTTALPFTHDDATLYGEIVMPTNGAPAAVVVLQYGSGKDSAVTYNYLQYLLPLYGIAVYVFDKRGTGRSTGDFTMEIPAMAADVAAAVEAVRARVGELPIGVMGESQGGWVVPLAATRVPVDFVVVSYGLAITMLEEDRQEVAQELKARGYGPEILARADEVQAAAARVIQSRFTEGMDELRRLKEKYGKEEWFRHLGGDFTGPMVSSDDADLAGIKAMFDFPYDLAYDPLPALRKLDRPQLWVLAGRDTEAPHETTLEILRDLQKDGRPIDIALFPNADHGIIELAGSGDALAGRHSEGYFDLLAHWIRSRDLAGSFGDARLYPQEDRR